MEIRYALPSDRKKIQELWEYCFSDTSNEVEFYFNNVYQEQNTLVAVENQRILGALQMNPYQLQVGIFIHRVHYIVGISIWPENRGQGIARQLIRKCLKILKKSEDIVLLMPIDTAIYRPFGFINAFFQLHAALDLKDLPRIAPTSCSIKKALDCPKAEFLLEELYQNAIDNKYTAIKRDSKYFEKRILDVRASNGEIYMIFNSENRVEGAFNFYLPKEGSGFVDELIFSKSEALYEVLKFCKGHQTQIQKINIQPVNSELFMFIMGFDNKVSFKLHPFMMARCLEPQNILKNLFFAPGIPDFYLVIKKDSLMDGDMTYFISPKHSLIKKIPNSSSVHPDIQITQEGLILWYLHGADFQMLKNSGDISISLSLAQTLDYSFSIFDNYANEFI